MKRLKELGFKKIKTEPGFHMYELTPARLPVASSKPQAASHKLQATSSQLQLENDLTNLDKGLYRTYESKRFR